ncbi:MAG: hypothetical protein IJ400_03820 [Clostridia bacterium]|nr:hypothetical protein [Clostridia bacterium]
MELFDILEIIMLICFGFSWPLNVIKAYKARTTKGKSLWFICLILLGYVAGITSKFVNPNFNMQEKWYVLFFYFLNFVMVSADLFMYFRNRRIDKSNKSQDE